MSPLNLMLMTITEIFFSFCTSWGNPKSIFTFINVFFLNLVGERVRPYTNSS